MFGIEHVKKLINLNLILKILTCYFFFFSTIIQKDFSPQRKILEKIN
jgi:hypothetical protein